MDISVTLFIILILNSYEIHGSRLPRIIEHPINVTVPRHEPATLNCNAEGDPPPIIEWYKNEIPLKIQPGSHRMLLPSGGLFFLKVVNSRHESDTGVYRCEAKNKLGTARSNNATLQVAVLRDKFRLEPQHTRTSQGSTILLECAPPKGIPEPEIIWLRNGVKIDVDITKRYRIVDGGNLSIQNTSKTDEGQYQCVAKNLVGIRESAIASVTVHVKPYIIRGPQDQFVNVGSSVTFQCRVGGDPMPDVLWRRSSSGGNMPLDRVHILEDRSLRLENVTQQDEGEYSCEADNSIGTITAKGLLTVYSQPVITLRPIPQYVQSSFAAKFECQSDGNPRPTIFWTIKGNQSLILSGLNTSSYDTTIQSNRSILTIHHTSYIDNGITLICNAINKVGSTSVSTQLSVYTMEQNQPPIIIEGPKNQTLPINSIAIFHCNAIGYPIPMITWYRNGLPINTSSHINISDIGALTIGNLQKNEDEKLYTCVASNRNGKSTWSAYLKLENSITNSNEILIKSLSDGPPEPPGRPKAINVTKNSITLHWSPSGRMNTSNIVLYSIEMYSENISKSWIPIVNKLNGTNYTEYDLEYGASYLFYVRAENLYGVSLPSPVSESIIVGDEIEMVDDTKLHDVQILLTNTNVVELLETNATDSTSVRISWHLLNNKYVEGFYIYSLVVNTVEYKMLTVLYTGNASVCTVNGLRKNTLYEFFLVPFYKTIDGIPSNSRSVRTLEDVPSDSPDGVEGLLLNSTTVLVQWQPLPNDSLNGNLTGYRIIVREHGSQNVTKLLNISIDAKSPTVLLNNFTRGVTYSVSVAAVTKIGVGPYSPPSTLRLDLKNDKLHQGFTRFSINQLPSDDMFIDIWFIAILCCGIVIVVILSIAILLMKRAHLLRKSTSSSNPHGNHAIGTIRKFPTLPLDSNGVWIDPTGGVWRQATVVNGKTRDKNSTPDYAQILPVDSGLSNTDKLSPINMPEYAEVANGCSTFKGPNSPIYDSCVAYNVSNPTNRNDEYQTDLVTNKLNNPSGRINYHYGDNINNLSISGSPQLDRKLPSKNINIIENKLEMMNKMNGSILSMANSMNRFDGMLTTSETDGNNSTTNLTSHSVPQTPIMSGLMGGTKLSRLPKYNHCDKINFGGYENDTASGQPLFVKSNDGSWHSVQNSTYQNVNLLNSSYDKLNSNTDSGSTTKLVSKRNNKS